MLRLARTRLLLLAVPVLGLPSLVCGQVLKPSGEPFGDQLRPGRRISVTDAKGQTFNGRIADVSGDSVLVRERGKKGLERRFSFEGPVTATVKKDPIWDGAAIGAGAFGGLTGILMYGGSYGSCEQANPRTFCADITITMTVVGAGLGALLDAARDRTEVQLVLRKPPESHAFRVTPVIGRGFRGVALSLGF